MSNNKVGIVQNDKTTTFTIIVYSPYIITQATSTMISSLIMIRRIRIRMTAKKPRRTRKSFRLIIVHVHV